MIGKKMTVGLFIQDQLKQDPVKYGSSFIRLVGFHYYCNSGRDWHPSLLLMTSVGLGLTGTVTNMLHEDPYIEMCIKKKKVAPKGLPYLISILIGLSLLSLCAAPLNISLDKYIILNFIVIYTTLNILLTTTKTFSFTIEESISVLNSSSQWIPNAWTVKSDRPFTTDQMNRLCDAVSTKQMTELHFVGMPLYGADVVRLANIKGLERLIFPSDTFLSNVSVSALASSPSLLYVAGGITGRQSDEERLRMALRRNLLMLQDTYRLHVLSPLMYEVTDNKPLLPEDVFRHIASFLSSIPTDEPNKPLEEVISHQKERSERSQHAFFSIPAPIENMNDDRDPSEYAFR